MGEPIENVNPLETPITPTEKVSKGTIEKLIAFFKKKDDNEVLEDLTGKPTLPVEDLTAQDKSPISPLDDFMKPKENKE